MQMEQAAAHANTRDFLNPAQRRAIEEVLCLTTRDHVHGLQGLAGTGKTTTLEAIREGAERNGYAVEGFAPTSRAVAQAYTGTNLIVQLKLVRIIRSPRGIRSNATFSDRYRYPR
jgi:putative protein kinase ArgK-like GTPase of G3E family